MPTDVPQRLDGWKAIADYLGRDVRTAQRWREERGMPVHRVPGGKGGVVFAFTSELNAWLASASAATGPAPRVTPLRGDAAGPEPTVAGPVPQPAQPDTRPWGPRWAAWVAALVAIAAALAAGASALWSRQPVRAVSLFELRGHSLVALDADRRQVWVHELPQSVPDENGRLQPAIPSWGGAGGGSAPIGRISAAPDHVGDLLAFVGFRRTPSAAIMTSEYVCLFSSAGRLKWQYTPRVAFEFRDAAFTGPWRTTASLRATAQGGDAFVAFIHETWWPSFLVRIDQQGAGSVAYVSAGHIESLSWADRPDGPHLLVGGVNNEYRGASVAVLDERSSPAMSPQTTGSAFTCAGCPEGRPLRYLVFPRSELNVAMGLPFNFATKIAVAPSGEVDVSVTEVRTANLRTVYHLDRDFTLQSVAMSDAYWEAHERMWTEGRLDHASKDCPERSRRMTVRMWEPDSGWRDVEVRQTFAPPSSAGDVPGT